MPGLSKSEARDWLLAQGKDILLKHHRAEVLDEMEDRQEVQDSEPYFIPDEGDFY